MSKRQERICAFIFGIIFLCFAIASSIIFEDPTPYQYTVFRIVLALAASGVATFIPGLINVKVGTIVRAGGAIAVFVIVYFFSPAALNKPSETRLNEASAEQVEFAYRAVFGERPEEKGPPLQGAKIGPPLPYYDFRTGKNLVDLFKNPTIKLVMPFYIDSKCPSAFLDGLVFAESLSNFLSEPVDIFILNLSDAPRRSEYRDFARKWKLDDRTYFLSGSTNQMSSVLRNFAIFRKEDKDSLGNVYHISYAPILSFVFLPDGNPGWIVDRGSKFEVARSILYHLSTSDPYLLDRKLLARHLPKTASSFVSTAFAQSTSSSVPVLRHTLERVERERTNAFEKDGGTLACHGGHHG